MQALYYKGVRARRLALSICALFMFCAAPEALAAPEAANESALQTSREEAAPTPGSEDSSLQIAPTPGSENISLTARPIVVTATRAERDLFEVPASVSAVSAEQIRREPRSTIAEQLQDVPGVQITNGGMGGGAKRITIRGESPSRVLVLIDGIKISEQKSMDGSMIMISPLNIERIEVIKGPASVLYGSEAIGGVVNIITKKGGDRPIQGGFAFTFDGSRDALTPYGALYGSSNGFSYRVSGDYVDAGDKRGGSGTIENSSYLQRNISAYLDYSWGSGKIGAGYDNFWSNIRIPGAVSDGAYVELGLPRWERERFYSFIEQEQISDWLHKVKLTGSYQKTEKNFWNNITASTYTPVFGPFYMQTDVWQHPVTFNEQKSYGLNLQTDWTLGKDHYVIAGVDYLYDDLEAISDNQGHVHIHGLAPGNIAINQFVDTSKYFTYKGGQKTLALFMQDEWSFHPDWTATIGLRQTWIRSELSDTNNPELNEGSNSDSNMVGSLGLVYTGFENWSLRTLYSQGYRYPLLNQLYIGTAHGSTGNLYPNADLDPETSHNFEVGARYEGNGFAADLAVYYNLANNYITNVSIANSNDSQFQNISKAKTFGSELTLSYTYEPLGLTPYLSGAYLHRTYDRGGEGGKTHRTGDPRWTGRVGVEYEREVTPWMDFHADVFGRFASRAKEDIRGEGTEIHAGWGTANLAFGVRLGEEKNYFVDVSLNNLFNKRYTLADSTLEEPGMHAVVSAGFEF